MTYSSGGLIQATDFNGFVSTGSPNINNVWSTGSTDSGWGQSALSTVSIGGTVTATNWASLVNTLASMGSQTGTTITSRSAPTAGQTISVLAAVATDITNCNTNRGNAAAVGSAYATWTGAIAKTTATGTGTNAWTITGGRVILNMSKTSTGTDNDPDWNTFVGKVGDLSFVGRVNGAAQTLAGTVFTGTTRSGGTGGTQTTLATTTGWYSLTAGAAATTIFQLNDNVSPYTGDTIIVTAAKNAGSTVLTLTTTWNSTSRTGAGQSTNISGGTDTASPFTGFGTAPAVLLRYVPPSTTYLSNTWGTPTIASSVA